MELVFLFVLNVLFLLLNSDST